MGNFLERRSQWRCFFIPRCGRVSERCSSMRRGPAVPQFAWILSLWMPDGIWVQLVQEDVCGYVWQINLLRLPSLSLSTVSFDPRCCGEEADSHSRRGASRALCPRCGFRAPVILIIMDFARLFGLSAASCSPHISLSFSLSLPLWLAHKGDQACRGQQECSCLAAYTSTLLECTNKCIYSSTK